MLQRRLGRLSFAEPGIKEVPGQDIPSGHAGK